MLELQDGTRMNSQGKVQNGVNLHNQGKKVVSASSIKWCNKFSRDNLKHMFYIACNLYEEAPFFSL
jgi:hypothetical protein